MCWLVMHRASRCAPSISRSISTWFGSALRSRWPPPFSWRLFHGCPRPTRRTGSLSRAAARALAEEASGGFICLPLPRSRRPSCCSPEQARDFYHEVVRRVGALPGVAQAASGFTVPWRDGRALNISFAFAVEGARRENGQDDLRARFRTVSPGFFETLGVPILEGRDFRDTAKDGSERVIIVSQSVARQLFPGREAIDRHLRWTDGVMKVIGISTEPRRIVGVVPDVYAQTIIPAPAMTVYQPYDPEGGTSRPVLRATNERY